MSPTTRTVAHRAGFRGPAVAQQ